ncbi:rhythmically expressed gene 5 protein [Sitophilus oryzae]|uniref:Rhythmically expressed gene 5 protein n=1 Tax=Sitophilus oryzae TaxID=7048 RepID=A0A6J2XWE7_SITOR|nr:rhythmically expressed gene 5 protein [Sitophilus oryzae]
MIGFVGILCVCALIGGSQGSAIPMWEFLSKQEKTSFIYSMFANQVERFCDGSDLTNCNRRLLKYGLGILRNLPEERLDAMDPYQRGANNIIWETLMTGHKFQKTTPKPRSTSSTAKPNSYEDQSFSDYEDFGTQSAASAKIDNVYVVAPPKGFVPKVQTEKTEFVEPKPEDSASSYIITFKKSDGKGVFSRFQNQYRPVAVTTEKIAPSTEKLYLNEFINPLSGPMVVKVFPDGTPVRESTQLPTDDDLRQYQLQHAKIPVF